jgi:dipeptidyl aminopeptidase/acylaminoacyl peptidase
MRLFLSAALSVAALTPLAAQTTTELTPFEFSIKNIMRGPEIVGRPPQDVRWTPDGRWIYFRWLEPGTSWREDLKPFRVRAVAGARPERLTAARMDSAAPLVAQGNLSRDRLSRAVEHDGDLYIVDMRRSTVRRLTDTRDRESSPKFDASGQRVFFLRDDNAFAIDLADGTVRQLTDIRRDTAARDSTPKGMQGALQREQSALFDVIRHQLRRDSIEKAERERRDSLRTKSFRLKRGERVATISVSPNGRALLLVTSIRGADSARQTIVPQYVTRTGYTDELRVRTKVGDTQDSGRVAFVSLPSGDVKWLRIVPDDTSRIAAQVSVRGWNDAGTAALVSAVTNDWKKRYLHTVSVTDGALKTVDILRDSAWIGGPCQSCAGWADDQRIWFVSETDGYAHLYTLGADGRGRRQLTSGKWEVVGAEMSPDKRWFWLHTSEASPFEQHFYRMPAAGGAREPGTRERVTREPGRHDVTVSPDGRLIADIHSTANRPPELYVGALAPNPALAQLTTSPTQDWLSFRWIKPEIVMIPASDGAQVSARIYRPADVGATPNGAGAIFVHGAGYLHNVHNWWSTYYREYMFNHFLASRGYVVLDIDYRGSAGYGRDWRTAIYRHMGGRDLQDHVDGARYLQKELGIDPERVGIYGGSYGGFITLMALFTEPEWFGAGAALRSVTDWQHYNHGYTSRILNLPYTDTVSYRRSSPIYFAEGLRDPLLIAHGMVDVNVHFQDVVRLAQRLIELQKTEWEMAVYPVEDHAFVRPDSWTDEYRRIFELFEKWLPARVAAQADAAGRAP